MKRTAASQLALVSVLVAASSATLLWAQGSGTRTTTPAPAATRTAAAPASAGAAAEYRTARDLYDQGKYAEAKVHVDAALQADPKLQDARLLQSLINAKLAEHPGAGATTAVAKDSLLTPEQISRIRLMELSDADATVQGSILRKDLEAFWDTVASKEAGVDTSREAKTQFLSSPLRAQIRRIKDANATQFYDKIKITSDPASLIAFRRRVQPFLIQNCATANCHGGADPHGYRIYGRPGAAPTDRETYTNFYMLATYAKNKLPMIDRDNPDQSLLLQYSLPKNGAAHPHPGNVDVPARLSGVNDPRFLDMVAWIRTLAYPTPKYGIAYVPVTATAPATGPATGTATTAPAGRK